MVHMRKVEKLRSGRYKVRFRYGVSPKTGRQKQASETFDRKRDADQFAVWLDALGPQGALDLLYEGEREKTIPTMNELAADHIEHLPGIEPGTRLNYQRLWDRTWAEHVGTIRAHHLTRDHISAALNALGARYSRKSLENQRGLLAGVLGRAVEAEHIKKNPAKGIRLPAGQPSRGTDDMRILTVEEFLTVENAMDPHYRPLLRFLWGTGCRWGEAVALPVGKVRLPYVHIHQALKWSPDGVREVGTTKTRAGRTIALPEDLHEEIAALCEGKKSGDLVFAAKRGGPVLHRTFWSRYWLPAVAHLDPPRPRIHDLRHSHASWLLANGADIKLVQARLGHKSGRVTIDTYSHLQPDAQVNAAKIAELAFRPRAIE